MTRRTRAFVLAALAILAIGIGTAGFASYMGLDRLNLLGSGKLDELSLVPDTVELVAFADVRKLMDSDLRHRLTPELRPQGGRDQLLEQTGIDIARDVDAVYLVVLPSDPLEQGGGLPLVVARGRFDQPRIEALVLSRNGTTTDYQGTRLVTAEPNVGVAFVSADLVAVGSPASVRRLLDTRAGRVPSVTGDAGLMRLVQRVAEADTWTVARIDTLRNRSGMPDFPAQLPAITWFAAGGDVGAEVSATIHAEARDAQAAEDLREIIRGIVALVRTQVGQQPEFTAVIDSIEMSSEGNTVSLGFSIPAEALDKLGALRSLVPVDTPNFQSPRPSRTAPPAAPSI
jgi:hypothetical protein